MLLALNSVKCDIALDILVHFGMMGALDLSDEILVTLTEMSTPDLDTDCELDHCVNFVVTTLVSVMTDVAFVLPTDLVPCKLDQ